MAKDDVAARKAADLANYIWREARMCAMDVRNTGASMDSTKQEKHITTALIAFGESVAIELAGRINADKLAVATNDLSEAKASLSLLKQAVKEFRQRCEQLSKELAKERNRKDETTTTEEP